MQRKTRSERMLEMYVSGHTLAHIGEVYELTRERVRQLITSEPAYKEARSKPRWRVARIFSICPICDKKIVQYVTQKLRTTCSNKCRVQWNIQQRALIKEKKCSRCKIVKDINAFYMHTNGIRYPHCGQCHAKICAKWRKKNPERAKEIQKNATDAYQKRKKNALHKGAVPVLS